VEWPTLLAGLINPSSIAIMICSINTLMFYVFCPAFIVCSAGGLLLYNS